MLALPSVTLAIEKYEATWNPVTFSREPLLIGSASVLMWPNGTYQFVGGIYNSSANSYDNAVMFAISGRNGYVLTFTHIGHVGGYLESGSQTDYWTHSGKSDYIATHWNDIVGSGWHAAAHTTLDTLPLWRELQSGIGNVREVYSVVGPILDPIRTGGEN